MAAAAILQKQRPNCHIVVANGLVNRESLDSAHSVSINRKKTSALLPLQRFRGAWI
ncbi:MAG: hypothetical protein AB4042_02390 [Leptolyngbyaceae cyanobacterium]